MSSAESEDGDPKLHVHLLKMPFGSLDQKEPLLLEVRIAGERLFDSTPSHDHERDGIDQAQFTLATLEEEVEARLVKRLVDPHDLDQGRKVAPKRADRFEPESPAQEGVRFHDHERSGEKRSASSIESLERTERAIVALILRVDERKKRGSVHENRAHSNASSR
jgi:hypothetical protein